MQLVLASVLQILRDPFAKVPCAQYAQPIDAHSVNRWAARAQSIAPGPNPPCLQHTHTICYRHRRSPTPVVGHPPHSRRPCRLDSEVVAVVCILPYRHEFSPVAVFREVFCFFLPRPLARLTVASSSRRRRSGAWSPTASSSPASAPSGGAGGAARPSAGRFWWPRSAAASWTPRHGALVAHSAACSVGRLSRRAGSFRASTEAPSRTDSRRGHSSDRSRGTLVAPGHPQVCCLNPSLSKYAQVCAVDGGSTEDRR
jgi:hypothetical protein